MKERDGEICKMSNQISDLMATNEELCRTKVKLEIRAVELEEQKDRWEDEKKELEQNIEQLKKDVKVKGNLIRQGVQNSVFIYKTRKKNLCQYIE